jgi:hypothetical protein
MPTVPYSGVPEVAPQMDATPRYQVDVKPEAFGVNVWEATQGLGQSVSKVGDELFARGLAMQDLANHSEAEKADADYMEQAGKLHADFSAKQGKDAVDGLPGHIQSLKDAREAIGKSLSNPMAQKLFNSQSLSTMGRTIFNAAGHAAEQNKQYAINSIESKLKNQTDLAATSNNPDDVTDAKQTVAKLSAQRAALKGLDPQSADEYTKAINSSLDLNVIKQTARTNPIKAKEMLEERKGGMTAGDYDRAQTLVDNGNRAVGAVNIAQKVIQKHLGDDGKSDVSFDKLQEEAEAEAKKVAPDDAIMQKHTVDTLKGLYNQKIYADKQFKWENTQTVDAAIQNGVKDVQQLRADPKVAEAIDNLPKSEQLKLPARINAYNAARDKVMNQEALTRLTGLRNNDVETFLNLDPTDPKLGLNQAQQREVMGWQAQDKKNQNGDPRVNRALSWLRDARGGELAALGVYHRDSKNPDDYDHMTGTLQSALDLWQQSKGKPPTYDEVVNTIGPQVIKSRAVPGTWWGTSDEPFYKPDYNSDEYKNFRAKVTKDITDTGAPPPSEAELDRAYTRTQLMKLYPPKAKPSDGK